MRMARLFDDAALDRLEINSAVLTGTPLTMACWFNSDSLTLTQCLMFLGDKDVTNQYFQLQAAGAIAGDPVAALVESGTTGQAISSTGYSANTWHHASAVFTSATSRTARIDGGSAGSNTANTTPTGLDRTGIGRRGSSSAGLYMSGLIAEAAIWNVALTAAEIGVLADGFCPLFVRPSALQAYWPLVGRYSPEISVFKGGFDLTVTGAVAGDHVRQIWKRKQRLIVPSPAVVAVGQPTMRRWGAIPGMPTTRPQIGARIG